MMKTPLRKIINDPQNFVDEVLDSIIAAHSGSYRFATSDRRAVVAVDAPRAGKVAIVTGGGSGHLPLFLGYVGRGLATAVAVGNVFSSPSPEQVLRATQAVSSGSGVLYLYGNYGGDVYNFDLAASMAGTKGIATETVLGNDDVLSAPLERAASRRGVAGLVLAYKTAGAAADRGDDLASVAAIARRTVAATRTAGVGLAPTILPAAGEPTFTLNVGEMEIGVGIHGESGVEKGPIQSADQIAASLFNSINAELQLETDDRVAVLVNGLGATPLEELYLLYGAVNARVAATGAAVVLNFIGQYATSLEMAGASISLLKLDAELEELLMAPAESPFFRPGNRVVAAPQTLESLNAQDQERHIRVTSFDSGLRSALITLAEQWPSHAPELRELDAALGDGDLGITVTAGCKAVLKRLEELPERAVSSDVLAEAGMAFAAGNPSTFAALIGAGVLAAASKVDDGRLFDRSAALELGRLFSDAVAKKGGAKLGDKTLLDMLQPMLEVLAQPDDLEAEVFDAAVRARGRDIANMQSRRGRAAWHQARSIGLRDPGAVAIGYALSILVRHATKS
ncbi:dihydroxyacetone kinase family protein [Pseudomonas putida]|uniref:dihydroxyacetone kinase family protein n=1 Tax=Pseudomonas putida TaxID=303 RepID=UPI00300ED129